MLKKKFLKWLSDLLKGIGFSLFAAAVVMAATPGTPPLAFGVALVMGAMLIVADLALLFYLHVTGQDS